MAAITFNEALEDHFKRKVRKLINEKGVSVSDGMMPDFAAYKYHCGIIKGLQDALEALDESVSELQTAGRGEDAEKNRRR